MSKKLKVQIKSYWGKVLFEYETEDNTVKKTAEEAVLRGADLRYADLSGADLRYADLSGADLSRADLSGAVLRGADLSDADLRYAVLRGADLSRADLRGADLSDADLRYADLSRADLRGADLSDADLRYADLSGAVLRGADLSRADLRDADLQPIKADLWELLLHAIPEIPALRQSIIDGKVNGSVYEGECACLVGTIANVKKCHYEEIEGIEPDSHRPAEAFFMNVKTGDTPETNQVSKITLGWIDELLALLNPPKPKKVKKAKS